MKYGLIGEKLSHSFSPEIHSKIGDYPYELREIARDDLDSFMRARDFSAINVTIPYKKDVIPYLDHVCPEAMSIGAVNTIVNKDGILYGYNTDIAGLKALILRVTGGQNLSGKVLVLGTGGTSLTAVAVSKMLGAETVLRVSRTGKDGCATYEEAYEKHIDASYIINCTPCGMYPSDFDKPIGLDAFPSLKGVVDTIYNPLRTPLIREAKSRCIPAEGGLYMLVSQGVAAYGLFFGIEPDTSMNDRIYREILREKENIVLVGMPSCGKTSIGKALSVTLGRHFYDSDNEITDEAGMSIPEIFLRFAEPHFRFLESKAIKRLSCGIWGAVIATGGGAVLKEENVDALKANGRLIFLDRSLDKLVPTADRPVSSDIEALTRRYEEREPIYRAVCDDIVDGDGSVVEVAALIIKLLKDDGNYEN